MQDSIRLKGSDPGPRPWMLQALGGGWVRWLFMLVLLFDFLFVASMIHEVRRGEVRICDFAAFYSAARLSQREGGVAPYDGKKMYAAEKEFVEPDFPWPLYWNYPPPNLVFMSPLSALGYHQALTAFLLFQAGLFFLLVTQTFKHPEACLAMFASPAVITCISYGQNGLLNAFLLCGGLWLVPGYPLTAGFLLGCLLYKPNICVLVPLALLAGRRYRALAAMTVTVLAWMAVSVGMFGMEPWWKFVAGMGRIEGLLQSGRLPLDDMFSPYSAAMLATGSYTFSKTVQGLGTLTAFATVAYAWYKTRGGAVASAVVIFAITLAAPWGGFYDLAMIAIAVGWLGLRQHSRPYGTPEALLLASAWILPAFAASLAKATHFQIAPWIHTAVLAWLIYLVYTQQTEDLALGAGEEEAAE